MANETCANPECDCHLSIADLAAKRGFCLCFPAIIPRKRYARPSLGCPMHKTLAARWGAIKTPEEFNAALLADWNPAWGTFKPATF